VVPLIRSFVYASLFVAFVLVFIPARLIELSGVTRPSVVGSAQIAGGAITVVGGILAFWCVVVLLVVGDDYIHVTILHYRAYICHTI
jgi:hypothetical protein